MQGNTYFRKRAIKEYNEEHGIDDEEEILHKKLNALNTFSLDLGDVINNQNKRIEKNTNNIKDMVKTLKRKLWNVETQKYSLFGAFLGLIVLFFIITRF
ncbi:hypothetical protein EHP00_476 [Ecytonucleospora hepatopenaei]|uniref:t-SNARE coiled-coil homology domain-containing protein n=1 Tax=Ecytonucleospora hepatopenaei TaxID=646526 RepID=A0A1W0E9B6_9MICR|nr:hypothetical protein EHP00_2587 [Ecytonucleospora hepatopenaei]OQS55759.1 hypothetical protein EHP00_476 [Ecytonucleospora hepatopenaei]